MLQFVSTFHTSRLDLQLVFTANHPWQSMCVTEKKTFNSLVICLHFAQKNTLHYTFCIIFAVACLLYLHLKEEATSDAVMKMLLLCAVGNLWSLKYGR